MRHRYKVGPLKTPLIVKLLLILTVSISVISAILLPILKINYSAFFLGLSLEGIKNFFLWQLITYNFLEIGFGININFIISLLFNMYLIWITATQIVERTSQIQYLVFYILSTIFSGFVILLTMFLGFKNMIFAGSTVGLYTTLIAWMMLNAKDTRIYLFFAIPLKHYWLVLGLIGFSLFSQLSSMQIVHFFAYLSVSIFAYFYSVIVWFRYSPFDFLNNMERSLIYTFRPIIEKIKKKHH